MWARRDAYFARAVVHRELRRPNMTLALLWEEYRGETGGQDGFGYSWFRDLYREWAKRLKPTLRQVHTAGERVLVDFAGHTMKVIDGANRRNTRGRDLHRRARRVELHFRGSGLDAVVTRLDRPARERAGVHGRRATPDRQRQSTRRDYTGPASTNRWSTAPTPTWRRTTAPR